MNHIEHHSIQLSIIIYEAIAAELIHTLSCNIKKLPVYITIYGIPIHPA